MCLGCGRGGRSSAAAMRLLDGWAFHRAIGTEDAAVACLGPKQRVATGAFVEVEARIGGHRFARHEAALRTGEGRLEDRLRMHCLAPNSYSPDQLVSTIEIRRTSARHNSSLIHRDGSWAVCPHR
jgi:hypothetical protein